MRSSSPFRSAAWLIAFAIGPMHKAPAAEALTLDLAGGRALEVIRVEPGTFVQGSPADEPGRGADETQRTVTLTRPFLLGKFPVLRRQFAHFVQESGYRTEAEVGTSGGFGWDGTQLTQRKEFTWRNPGFAQTDDDPVTLVTHRDAGAFLQWLSRKTGRTFSLPSEAQWEYAARASGTFSTDAWNKENSGNATHPVGQKPANAWGFSDMLGNVWEWCEDWYAPYEAADISDPLQRNSKLSDKPRRVLRGGSWLRDAKFCRPAARYRNDPLSRNADNGFRVMTFDLEARAPAPAAPAPSVNLEANEPRPIEPAAPATISHFDSDLVSQGGARRGFAWVIAFIFAAVFLTFIATIIRGIARLHSRSSGTSSSNSPLPPRSSSGPIRVRIGEDGFWIDGAGISRGTIVSCRYSVGGHSQATEVRYEPGPNGHFVFTGSRPSNVSASAGRGSASGSNVSRRIGEGIGMDSALDNDSPFRGHPSAY